jgi:hypothetical protein
LIKDQLLLQEDTFIHAFLFSLSVFIDGPIMMQFLWLMGPIKKTRRKDNFFINLFLLRPGLKGTKNLKIIWARSITRQRFKEIELPINGPTVRNVSDLRLRSHSLLAVKASDSEQVVTLKRSCSWA